MNGLVSIPCMDRHSRTSATQHQAGGFVSQCQGQCGVLSKTTAPSAGWCRNLMCEYQLGLSDHRFTFLTTARVEKQQCAYGRPRSLLR